MELFSSFIYQFPLMFAQPMPPLLDGCLIYEVMECCFLTILHSEHNLVETLLQIHSCEDV
jgi:hypothetical protein